MVRKLKSRLAGKKGFTLAELLIVVAIVAVLAAIALPVFGSQLAKAQEAVKVANKRAIKAEATATAMTQDGFKETSMTYYVDSVGNVTSTNAPTTYPYTEYEVTFTYQDNTHPGVGLVSVTVEDGKEIKSAADT